MNREADAANIVQQCTALVRRVLEGTISFEAYTNEWPIEADDIPGLWELMNQASNYLGDEDVRARDPEFAIETRRSLESALVAFEHEHNLA